MSNKTGWNLMLPMKGIFVLIVMAVHPQSYEWWLYLLVLFASLQFRRY